jgi:uncharacterized protein YegL
VPCGSGFGEPNEGPAWSEACREANQAISAKKASVFAIAVDSGHPSQLEQCVAELQKVTPRKVAVMDSVKFSEFFVCLSNSMALASDTTAESPAMASDLGWSRA